MSKSYVDSLVPPSLVAQPGRLLLCLTLTRRHALHAGAHPAAAYTFNGIPENY